LSIVSRVLRLGQDLPLLKRCEYALLSHQLKPFSTVLDCIRLTKHWPRPIAATHYTCHVTNCTCHVTHCTCHVTNCSCHVTHCTCHVTTIESLIGRTKYAIRWITALLRAHEIELWNSSGLAATHNCQLLPASWLNFVKLIYGHTSRMLLAALQPSVSVWNSSIQAHYPVTHTHHYS